MKKINILLMLVLVATATFAQNSTKALLTNGNNVQLLDFNVADFEVEKVIANIPFNQTILLNQTILPNSFMYNQVKERAYFITYESFGGNEEFNRNNQLIGVNSSTGEVQSFVRFNGKIFGNVLMPRSNAVGIFVAQKEFNQYGNNDESVAFIVLEEGTGRMKANIRLDFLSLNTPSMPFYGKIMVNDRNKDSRLTDFGISSPAYNVDRNQVVFTAIDVTGVKRIYTLDINTGKVVSQRSVQEDIIDLVYISTSKSFKAIYFKADEYGAGIYAGDLDPMTGRFSNTDFIAAQTFLPMKNVYIVDGAIRYDQINNRIFVLKNTTTTQMEAIELDVLTNKVVDRKVRDRESIDFKYPYNESQSSPYTASTAIKIYPNPALETIQVETFFNDLAQHIKIYDINGKLVKDVLVESGKEVNTLSIGNLKPGVYSVDIETEHNLMTRRLIVQ